MSTADNPISHKAFGRLILHDKRKAAPPGFVDVDDLPAHQPHHRTPHDSDKAINLQIGLRGRDTPGLVKRLYEISTPGSPSYGEYLSKDEAELYARPTDETLREVRAWLELEQVQFRDISPSGNRIQITLSVSKANEMFQANFKTFIHTETGTESLQSLYYSLPSEVESIIESVEPTTSFPNPVPRPVVRSFADSSDSNARPTQQIVVTPSVLKILYGIPSAKATQTRNLLSVAGFLDQYANRADLKSFLSINRPDLITATITDGSINDGQNDQDPAKAGEEANLDIQYTVGLVNFAPVEFLSSGKADINSWIKIADHWLAQDNPPTVVSISYGFQEYQVSKDSAKTLSNRYAQLGARGVSILVSTGDGGVAGSQPPSGEIPYKFIPTFPASCPYVTAVGATRAYPEVAAPLSAGGFSNHFTRDEASYQKDAVNGYLDQIGSLYEDRFNRNGRAYPDISAQGENVVIVHKQDYKLTGGTSASAPACASVVTLLNDRLIQHKGRSLGFLNPLLYANPTVLNDIIEGSNPGCGTDGFPAKPGWDPVTGLGTPDFVAMEKVIIAPSIGNGNKRRNLWVKHPNGNMKQIVPGASIVPNNMVPGNYEIASVDTVPPPHPAPPPPPLGANVFVANVGNGTLVFICPWNDDKNFILPNGTWKALENVDYVVSINN